MDGWRDGRMDGCLIIRKKRSGRLVEGSEGSRSSLMLHGLCCREGEHVTHDYIPLFIDSLSKLLVEHLLLIDG